MGDQLPELELEEWCQSQMKEAAVILERRQREIVNAVVRDHCGIRGWNLLAVDCRSNHCHVVVTATDVDGDQVRSQLKAWAKRRLKEDQRDQCGGDADVQVRWWTRKGSVRHLFDEESLEAAVIYTLEAQDAGGSKVNLREM
jgi:REP element-mobilizing transposase RayT